MNIGARIIKTGLSVTLAILIANYFNFNPSVLAGIAAVLAIQPSIMRSWRYVKEVTTGNIIGATFAVLGFYIFGSEPIYVGIVVVLTLAVNIKLGLTKTINLSVLTVIAILTSDLANSAIDSILSRFLLIAIGVLSSFVINLIIMPPKHEERFYTNIKTISDKLNILLRIVPNKEYSISTFKKEKDSLEKMYSKTKEMFDILNEEKRKLWVKDRVFFIRNIVIFRQMLKVIKKEIALFENIETNFNKMREISSKETENVQNTVNELLQYQESILLVYEDKVAISGNKVKEKNKKIENRLKVTVNELMKHYDPANEELWWRLFPIVNALIETENALERLELLVRVEKQRKQKKKPKTSKKTQR